MICFSLLFDMYRITTFLLNLFNCRHSFLTSNFVKIFNPRAILNLHQSARRISDCAGWRTFEVWWRRQGQPWGAYGLSSPEDTCLWYHFVGSKIPSFHWSKNSSYLLGELKRVVLSLGRELMMDLIADNAR